MTKKIKLSRRNLNLPYQILIKSRNTLIDGEIPPKLEFLKGGPSLRFEQIINNLGINQDSRDFVNFLPDDLCQALMQRNKLNIHKETVNIYYDNIDVVDYIYSFIIAQQDHTKKLMSEEFQFFDSHKDYVINYLTQIESESKDVLDMVSHKNTKFLFLSIPSVFSAINKTHCNSRR